LRAQAEVGDQRQTALPSDWRRAAVDPGSRVAVQAELQAGGVGKLVHAGIVPAGFSLVGETR
jgi:hypothetical protein